MCISLRKDNLVGSRVSLEHESIHAFACRSRIAFSELGESFGLSPHECRMSVHVGVRPPAHLGETILLKEHDSSQKNNCFN